MSVTTWLYYEAKSRKAKLKTHTHTQIFIESSKLGTLILNFLQLLKSTRQRSNMETRYKGKEASCRICSLRFFFF